MCYMNKVLTPPGQVPPDAAGIPVLAKPQCILTDCGEDVPYPPGAQVITAIMLRVVYIFCMDWCVLGLGQNGSCGLHRLQAPYSSDSVELNCSLAQLLAQLRACAHGCVAEPPAALRAHMRPGRRGAWCATAVHTAVRTPAAVRLCVPTASSHCLSSLWCSWPVELPAGCDVRARSQRRILAG